MKQTVLLTLTLAAATIFNGSASGADFDTVAVAPATEAVSGQYLREAIHEKPRTDRALVAWKLSLVPLAGTQFLDAYSSRGLHELNPVLAGPNGQFGTKAMLLKVGVVGALAGVEYLVIRKHPAAAKAFWKVNLVSSAVTGGVAAHNFTQH